MASVTVALAGCANDAVPNANGESARPGGTQSTQAGPREVEFADQVCAGLIKFFEPALAMGNFTPDRSSPGATVNSIKDALRKLDGGLQAAVSDLGRIDTSRVSGGPDVINGFTAGFGQLRQRVEASIGVLDAVDPNDQSAAAAALKQVGTELRGVGDLQGSFGALANASPQLDAAAQQAPNCDSIERMVAAAAGSETGQSPSATTPSGR
mgnify:CR=1 FL=1